MALNKLSLKGSLREVEIVCKKCGYDEKGILINKLYFLKQGKVDVEDTLKEIIKDKKFLENELIKIEKIRKGIEKRLKEMEG